MLIMKPESPAFFFGKFERYSTILGCGLMARRCAVNADDDGSNPSIPAIKFNSLNLLQIESKKDLTYPRLDRIKNYWIKRKVFN